MATIDISTATNGISIPTNIISTATTDIINQFIKLIEMSNSQWFRFINDNHQLNSIQITPGVIIGGGIMVELLNQ